MGTVRLEKTISGETATLKWCCRFCSHDWPVDEDEGEADLSNV
jgi:hypothetical protein